MTPAPHNPPPALTVPLSPDAGVFARFFDGNVWHSFKQSPMAIVAAVIALVCVVSALGANWLAPHNPMDLATLDLGERLKLYQTLPSRKRANALAPGGRGAVKGVDVV